MKRKEVHSDSLGSRENEIKLDLQELAIVNEVLSLDIAARTILQTAFEHASGIKEIDIYKRFKGVLDGQPVMATISSVYREGENSKGLPEGEYLGQYEWAKFWVFLGDSINLQSRMPTYTVTIQHAPRSLLWQASSDGRSSFDDDGSKGCPANLGPFTMQQIARYGKNDESIHYLGESLRAIAKVAEAIQQRTISPVQKKTDHRSGPVLD